MRLERESRPAYSSEATITKTSGRDSQSIPRQCHVDRYGLLDLGCFYMVQDAEERGFIRGFAAGLAQVQADIDLAAVQVVAGAARSIDIVAARARSDARWSA